MDSPLWLEKIRNRPKGNIFVKTEVGGYHAAEGAKYEIDGVTGGGEGSP